MYSKLLTLGLLGLATAKPDDYTANDPDVSGCRACLLLPSPPSSKLAAHLVHFGIIIATHACHTYRDADDTHA
jgi:hypothetical protein